MIFVIIIEDFWRFEQKEEQIDKDKTEICFICGVDKDTLEKKEKNLRFILIKYKIFGLMLIICLGWFVIFKKLIQLIVMLWKIWKEKNRYGKCILMKL